MNTVTERAAQLYGASMQALDLLGIGWLVCDSNRRVVGANRIANRILTTQDGIRLNSDGVLHLTRGGSEILSDAVQQAARAGARLQGTKRHHSLLLAKRDTGKRAFTLVVRSVQSSSAKHCRPPLALMLIVDPSLSARPSESDLRQLYGFTSRESSLAALLMDGSTLDDCCCQLGIRRSTIRTHLKQMFKKSRVHRQGEMVSILMKSIGLMRLRDQGADTDTLMQQPFGSWTDSIVSETCTWVPPAACSITSTAISRSGNDRRRLF